MTITVISSGVSSSGVTLNSPDEIAVARGGVVSAITVSSGGLLTVYAHGTATSSVILDGGEEDVFGGTETGAVVGGTTQLYTGAVQSVAFAGSTVGTTLLEGGIQFVSNRGTTAGTVVSSGGQQVIEGSGAAANTVVSAGGRQYVSGAANTTSVLDQGTMYVQDGGVAGGALISSGGLEVVSSAGTDKGGTVLDGGIQQITALGFGSATLVSSGGLQVVYTGGTLASGTVLSGGATTLSGGQATSMTIGAGGTETIFDGGIDGAATVQSGGVQLISSGGRANGTDIWLGGTQNVSSGGLAAGAKVLGLQSVLVGAAVSGSVASVSGVIDVAGTASGSVISAGGTQVVSSGATVSSTVVSAGGSENLLSGATVSGTLLLGGAQHVTSGAFASATIARSGGAEIVSAGGLTSNTVVSSGGTEILSGGSASGTTLLYGGLQIASSGGIGAGTTVSNGGQAVASAGGVLSGGTILLGGSVLIRSGGVGSSQTVSSGAVEIVSAGGSAVGAVVTGSGAVLVISSGGLSTSAVISGGGVELVSAGGVTSGSEINSGGQQAIVAGSAGGAILDAGSIQTLSAGGIASGTAVSSGSQQRVVAGGFASASMVAGSVIVTSGGTANGGTLISGGSETVSAGGAASGTVVSDGGQEMVLSGGVASGAILLSGGTQTISSGGVGRATSVSAGGSLAITAGGTASGTILSSGGTATVSGTLSGANLSGGNATVSAGGIASGTQVSSGTLTMSSGGIARSGQVTSTGFEVISAGGVASATVLSGGGRQSVLSGGVASATVISSGGQMTIASGGGAVDVRGALGGAIVNHGVISGTVATSGTAIAGSGGPVTVSNDGTIAGTGLVGGVAIDLAAGGTVSNAGVIAGSNGTAIVFGGGTSNTLIMDVAGSITGVVSAVSSASNTLELSGTTGTGIISGYGTKFLGFQTLQVDSGSTWELAGTTVLGSGTTVIDDGTLLIGTGDSLTLAGGVSFASTSGTLAIADGGMLTLGGSVASGEVIDLVGSASKVVINDPANFGGVLAHFTRGDTVDLRSLPLSGTMVTTSGTTLTIQNGANLYAFALDAALPANSVIQLTADGVGGTNIRLVPLVTEALANDTGASSSDGLTSDGTLVGVADPNSTVTFYEGGAAIGSATATSSGTYSFLAGGLAQGAHTISAVQTDAGSNTGSAVFAFTLDTVAPAAATSVRLDPASDTGALGDRITSVTTPAIIGSGVTGNTITLFDGSTLVGSATVVSGTWSIVPGGALADGVHSFTVVQTDPAGNASPSAALSVTIDATAPATPANLALAPASDTGVLLDNITAADRPGITGSGMTGDAVVVYDGVIAVGSATVVSGVWSVTPGTALADGVHHFTAIESDVAGNGSAATAALDITIDTAAPATPTGMVLDPGSDTGTLLDRITATVLPAITGSGTDGDVVTLYDETTAVGSAAVVSGTWSITPGTALIDGVHHFTATESDTAGNTSSPTAALDLTIDTTAPATPTGFRLAPGSDTGVLLDNVTATTQPAIIGSGVTGDTVKLYEGSTLLGSAPVVSGAWSITPGSALADGVHTLTATATDPAGNTSPASASLALTIDATAPATPTGLLLDPASDTGVLLDNVTATTPPAITGSGTTGDTVTLYEGNTLLGSATVVNGAWSIMPGSVLADGVHSLTAIATDTAGNASQASAPLAITIDRTAPATPTALVLDPSSDTGVALDNITATTQPSITGNGTTGDTIWLYDGPNTRIGTATVVNGAWSITPASPLGDGLHGFTAYSVNSAGNVSSPSALLAVTIDTTAPSAPAALLLAPGSDTGMLLDNVTAATQPAITGSGISGDTVVLYEGSSLLGSATVVNGAWSITPGSALTDGVHTLTATATDPAGNISPASGPLALTIDTTAPSAPTGLLLDPGSDTGVLLDTITATRQPTITGSGITGDTVKLYEGSTLLGSATVVNGAWSITAASALANGPYSLTATSTDPAGNVSGPSVALGLTIDVPAAPAALTLDPASDTGILLDNVTATVQPAITGLGATGDTIKLYEGSTLLGSATVVNGAWSITPGSALADGVHSLTATTTNAAGNTSFASAPLAITIDTIAPAAPSGLLLDPASDTGVLLDFVTATRQPAITGSGTTGDTVALYEGSSLFGSATVVNGAWSITPGSALADGVHSLTATATDPAGNTSSASVPLVLTIDTTAPSAPAGLLLDPDSDTGVANDRITARTSPAINGTGLTGATVTLYEGGVALGSGTVVGGVWSVTPGSPLVDGVHRLTAIQTDPAGNASVPSAALDLTIDSQAPSAPGALTLSPVSDTGVPGDRQTRITMPVITGTGPGNGDTVTLYEGGVAIGSGIVGNGSWAIAPSAPLQDGVHRFTATETDAAGNVSAVSAPLDITIRTVTPAAPTGLALTPASDTGVPGDRVTNVTTPAVTGAGLDGDAVTLLDGFTPIGTATVVNGVWSIRPGQPLTDGAHRLTAKQTDAAGNVSPVSAPLDIAIDSLAPAAPGGLALTPASDTGAPGDRITRASMPTILGTGATGETVTLYDGGVAIGSAVVVDGSWAIAAPTALRDGVHRFTAVQSDLAGNVSAPSTTLDVTIDTVAPPAPTLTAPAPSTNPAQPVIGGLAEPGATVRLFEGSASVGSARADSAGVWQFAFGAPLSAGAHSLTATATDGAGGTSPLSALLTVTIAADQSYTVTTATSTGQTIAQMYAPTGQIDRIDTFNTNGLVKSVSNTKAILQIYDDAGRLIGTITQPSQSAFSQPVFDSTGKPLAATTVSGPVGSEIAFLMETNEITTQGNDTVSAGSGDSIVFAAGPSTKVIGGSGTLLFVGGAGTATVTGGSGSSSVFGAAGGGYLEGGSAGRNVLVAGGGNTTLVGGGTGDILVATTGTTQMMLKAGNVAFGGSGDTTMHGASGSVMVSNTGHDLMIAGDGEESLYAGTGETILIGGTGNNTLVGGNGGHTTIMGGSGNDLIVGAAGSTVIVGGNGTDTIFAGTGDTIVTEGNGTNLMVFNSGNATVTGGTGRDTYIVSNGHAGGRELIQNFKVGVDQIQTFGYAAGSTRVQAVGANTLVSLSDGTTITLAGVTQLSPNSIV